jgi:hypothetical protein
VNVCQPVMVSEPVMVRERVVQAARGMRQAADALVRDTEEAVAPSRRMFGSAGVPTPPAGTPPAAAKQLTLCPSLSGAASARAPAHARVHLLRPQAGELAGVPRRLSQGAAPHRRRASSHVGERCDPAGCPAPKKSLEGWNGHVAVHTRLVSWQRPPCGWPGLVCLGSPGLCCRTTIVGQLAR